MEHQLNAKALFNSDQVKSKFAELLGKRATAFITSVLQIVASNNLLTKADPNSIYHAAAVAATLDLPLNNNLGFAYIVPYNAKQTDGSYKQVAQFQLGYKGFIQLAQRSGQFKTISATPIYDGQLIDKNPLTGFIFDFTKCSEKIIGYAAYFELLNGFQKTIFMTIDEVKKHGGKYSKTFTHKSGLWNTDFDSMAQKTVLKLLLSKFAPLSVEMQKAVVTDQALINNDEGTEVTYVDHEVVEIDKEAERILLMMEQCKDETELEVLRQHVKPEQMDMFNQRMEELKNGE